jgi:hypothetical protein
MGRQGINRPLCARSEPPSQHAESSIARHAPELSPRVLFATGTCLPAQGGQRARSGIELTPLCSIRDRARSRPPPKRAPSAHEHEPGASTALRQARRRPNRACTSHTRPPEPRWRRLSGAGRRPGRAGARSRVLRPARSVIDRTRARSMTDCAGGEELRGERRCESPRGVTRSRGRVRLAGGRGVWSAA